MLRVRPAILSEVFTNLAAGWFGLLLITPTAIASDSFLVTAAQVMKALLAGIISLLFAEQLAHIGERRNS